MQWYEAGLICIFMVLASVASYAWWDILIRRSYVQRLEDLLASVSERSHHRVLRLFPRQYRFLPLMLCGGVLMLLVQFGDVPLPFAVAASILLGVVSYLIEAHFVRRQLDTIEQQLADSIDMIVGLLQSGMALPKTLEMVMHETEQPLKHYLTDMVGRIHLGDDPSSVIQQLGKQIPLETFQLFSSILSVQWWSGGSLSSTLANVSAVVRSRMELDRRIRTQSIESQLSVLSILLITYGLSIMMWYVNPTSMEHFLSTTAGVYLGAGAIMAQAIGIIWISKLSEIHF